MKMVKFASEVNPDNLLFGTDFPFNNCFDQETPLKKMYEMDIPDNIKYNILGKKAFKLFRFDKIPNTRTVIHLYFQITVVIGRIFFQFFSK